MFLSLVIYMIIFFRIWWAVLFGSMTGVGLYPRLTLRRSDVYICAYIIGFQYLLGFQPNILGCLIFSSVDDHMAFS